ncbi:hypothetical protein A3G55_02195 [Candidatus Giovannonibacteria bacterium RIFCSPLOWO2_12_FULL_44_25]|uniref:Uncharacterized protein n=1 Tax=Candidatus Giovannonibacteria bacterium RIFCSPHIGHO2_02_FULL_45_40 TaxID=1798337 RepID=A0A1F5W8I3_9BACT|nr:MAG: hypothetical protein A2120_01115 [Candidatus Giovannonibacteria bacterium GWA2_45_15]OGF60058.1 MAG: hypothetical protein A2W40_00660 [Candidatus Giovannonibacteria bacterium RIFCSPHIGHO2_01_45_12]OGF60254.1 MAG: hypothetical protein A2656_00270 [Candidatus Giovannonibacteria bacterium RIFCSPHIGHO2_01_FULL_44_100]OGF71954.1 MAG: hypothetical protein A3C05_00395 [Candidatus Giovannonibacteria bacterium RIFCSPHIGHO2_02_FULL_45_40]OGF83599.1 MAG: hypothetical protein A3E63_04525 [Candidatu
MIWHKSKINQLNISVFFNIYKFILSNIENPIFNKMQYLPIYFIEISWRLEIYNEKQKSNPIAFLGKNRLLIIASIVDVVIFIRCYWCFAHGWMIAHLNILSKARFWTKYARTVQRGFEVKY